MSHEIKLTRQPTFEEVREQFDYWRSTRKKRGPIPEMLWEAAVNLTNEYSIHQISKTLRLNYQKFKELAQRKVKGKDDTIASRPQFLELNVSKPYNPVECVIEIEGLQGSRMKMSLKGETGFDLLEWAKIVWEREA